MSFYIEIGLVVGLLLFVFIYSMLNPDISKARTAGTTTIFLIIAFICFITYRQGI